LDYRRFASIGKCDVDNIYTIIFLALAVFIFLRLRSVLGQRTGAERPPYDRRDVLQGSARGDNNKAMPLPGNVIEHAPAAAPAETAPPVDRWKGVAEPGSDLALGLNAVVRLDSSFDLPHFLSGAKSAYEMIVLAFANGDRRTLSDLLSGEVYEGFESAIREREQRGEKVERKFVGIDKTELVGAEVRGKMAHLTVRFVSQIISVTRDRSGAVIDGSPDKVADVTDVWTFARDVASRDPNWKLVGTESGH
jgi:predicted lipid-binding transport protein (Tim44 family)